MLANVRKRDAHTAQTGWGWEVNRLQVCWWAEQVKVGHLLSLTIAAWTCANPLLTCKLTLFQKRSTLSSRVSHRAATCEQRCGSKVPAFDEQENSPVLTLFRHVAPRSHFRKALSSFSFWNVYGRKIGIRRVERVSALHNVKVACWQTRQTENKWKTDASTATNRQKHTHASVCKESESSE